MLPSAPRDQRLRLSDRLRKTAAYQRCYRLGRRRSGRFLILYTLPGTSPTLFGQTASRKVGGAVVRHRLKRWGREVFRRFAGRDRLPGGDLVVHFRPEAAQAEYVDFARDLEQQLRQLLPREAK